MASSKTNNDLCTEFSKWVVRLTIDSRRYYILWGYDTSTVNDDIRVLIGEDGNILLFRQLKTLLEYIPTSNFLFDRKTTLLWLKKINKPLRSHTSVDLDILKNKRISISNRLNFENLISAYEIAEDCSDSIGNKQLLKLTKSAQAKNLFNYYCNLYLWAKDKKAIAANQKKIDKVLLEKDLQNIHKILVQHTTVI